MDKFKPYIHTLKSTKGRNSCFHSFCALSLSRIASFDLVAPVANDPRRYVEQLLNRQIDFIGCLDNQKSDRAFELRFIVYPNPETKNNGLVKLYLIAKVESRNKAKSVYLASELANELWGLLNSGFYEYEFNIVTDRFESKKIFNPFDFRHIVEIVRREDYIPLDSALHLGSRRGIGFLKKKTLSANKPRNASEQVNGVYYVFPFIENNNSLLRLFKEMLYQSNPFLISIGLKPTQLKEEEQIAFDDLVVECERYWQTHPAGAVTDPSQLHPTLQLYAQALRQAIASQSMCLEDATFLMRIQIASAKPISQALIDTLGVEITEAVGQVEGIDDTLLSQHLSGGYDWMSPDRPHQQKVARNNLKYLEHNVWVKSIAPAKLCRWRYLFNPREVNAAFRLPIPQMEDFSGIETKLSRTAQVAGHLNQEGVFLGVNQHRGTKQPVYLPDVERSRHLYAVGQTGTGKTTFFENMILQDLRKGYGLCLLDPHGDLVERVLQKIPDSRTDDVILFDAGLRERPFGLNLLQWQNEDHKHFLVQELLAIMRRLVPDPQMRGPVFEHFVRMFALTLMANPDDPGTLVEFPRLMIDENYHERWLPYIEDPLVRHFWEYEYKNMTSYHRSEISGYIISKFDGLIVDSLMRNIIGQRESSLDFSDIMENNKVLLVNLAKGRLGELNSNLLGMVLVAKFKATAFSRIKRNSKKCKKFFLYVDEFQNIATDNFTIMLAEARKYGLCLVITNQYLNQLKSYFADPGIIDAIIGNVGTLISFRIGAKDAGFLAPKFAPVFKEKDLINLSNFEMYVSSSVEGETVRPFSLKSIRDETPGAAKVANKIRRQSRKIYGTPRKKVESRLIKSLEFKG